MMQEGTVWKACLSKSAVCLSCFACSCLTPSATDLPQSTEVQFELLQQGQMLPFWKPSARGRTSSSVTSCRVVAMFKVLSHHTEYCSISCTADSGFTWPVVQLQNVKQIDGQIACSFRLDMVC